LTTKKPVKDGESSEMAFKLTELLRVQW